MQKYENLVPFSRLYDNFISRLTEAADYSCLICRRNDLLFYNKIIFLFSQIDPGDEVSFASYTSMLHYIFMKQVMLIIS